MTDLICIVCPKGCHLKVDEENGYKVTGNGCPRGAAYGEKRTGKSNTSDHFYSQSRSKRLQEEFQSKPQVIFQRVKSMIS